MFIKKNRIICILCCFLISIACLSSTSYASSWYVGVAKWGNYFGIQADITAPTYLPQLGSNGESCWVSSQFFDTNNNNCWIQTGLRYYSGFSALKTYVETKSNGIYNMNEIGIHPLDESKNYCVRWIPNTYYWEARVNGAQVATNMYSSIYANVEAYAESHATDTQLGPFIFSNVKYVNNNMQLTNMDVAPTASYPYHVTYYGTNYTYFIVN